MAPRKKAPESDSDSDLSSILPRKEPVQARSRERFERILEVFRDLTIGRGVDAVSMKDVAGGAGISIASLYQYFPDKAAVIATLADRYNREGERCVEEIIAGVSSASDLEPALVAILDAYYEFFSSVPGSYAIWQAGQADVRLHQLDENHCDTVAGSIARALTVALPHLGKRDSLRHACLFTILIASVVRKAATLPRKEAEALLAAYRDHHLGSALRDLANGGA